MAISSTGNPFGAPTPGVYNPLSAQGVSAYYDQFGNWLGGALDFGAQGFLGSSYDDYMNSFGSQPNSQPTDFGGYMAVGDSKKTGTELPSSKTPSFNFGNAFSGLGKAIGMGGGTAANAGSSLADYFSNLFGDQKSVADFGFQGVGPGGPNNGGGFDPWAGNPYAAGIGNQIYQGFLNNQNVAGYTSAVIGDQLNQNANRMQQNEVNRAQYDLQQTALANQKAQVDAQLALAQSQLDAQSQQAAAELKLQSDQLAAQIAQNEAQQAYLNSQLAQQGDLGNRQLDLQGQQSADQLAALMAQIEASLSLGNRQLDIQDKSATDASANLAFQQWLAQQQLNQQNQDRTQKSDLFNLIAGMFGGSGGLGGAGGGGAGSGGAGGGGTGGVGFQAPGGQYAINTGITAGGLNPNAIRSGVSAIEGTGASNYGGSGPGMTGAQQKALAQDYGATSLAGGQAAATDALRTLLPANADLARTAGRAQTDMDLAYRSFLAEQERNRKGESLGQFDTMYDLLRAYLA